MVFRAQLLVFGLADKKLLVQHAVLLPEKYALKTDVAGDVLGGHSVRNQLV